MGIVPSKCSAQCLARSQCPTHVGIDAVFVALSFIFIVIIVFLTPQGPWDLGRAEMVMTTSQLGTWRRDSTSPGSHLSPELPPL